METIIIASSFYHHLVTHAPFNNVESDGRADAMLFYWNNTVISCDFEKRIIMLSS
jgi:hypothetical protein